MMAFFPTYMSLWYRSSSDVTVTDSKMDLDETSLDNVSLESLTAFTGRSQFCDPHTTFSTFGFASFLMITLQVVINIITSKDC